MTGSPEQYSLESKGSKIENSSTSEALLGMPRSFSDTDFYTLEDKAKVFEIIQAVFG